MKAGMQTLRDKYYEHLDKFLKYVNNPKESYGSDNSLKLKEGLQAIAGGLQVERVYQEVNGAPSLTSGDYNENKKLLKP